MHNKIIFLPKLVMILILILVTMSSVSMAGSKIVPVDGVKFTINASMMDNLNQLTGKKVILSLNGGKVLGGTVKSVGTHFVHLEKLQQKEFFDSLIRIDSIQSIDVQFRKYQR